MEYYFRFRETILLLKVGYPLITHPFAAILENKANIESEDFQYTS